jgi:hypothetical protein
MLADQLGQANEDALPLLRGFARPNTRLECRTRPADGTVDVICITRGNGRNRLAGRRVDAVERLTRRGVDVGAVEESLLADGQVW